eukprot:TRINITY_DN3950_c0_g1_i3.p1 TRINITY_DN3950_c0_g1~~TRINITY_DN3950_c0_g1_i3.p1  ORF type:complete len:264 (+),score=59.96 TRINITY_DN3950_c0_g1_i3:75-866(+)
MCIRDSNKTLTEAQKAERMSNEETKDKEPCEEESSPKSYNHQRCRKFTKDLTGYVATRWYRAPEIILCQANYGPGIDVWALGCVFAELLAMANTGIEPKDRKPFFPGSSSYPYSPARNEKLKCGISMVETDQLNVTLKTLGAPTREDCDFLKDERRTKLLTEMHAGKSELEERIPSASREAIDLLKKMVQFSPIVRATVDECLSHPYFASIRDKTSEVVAPAKVEFDFEAQSYLSKEKLKELIDEELNYFKTLRERGKIMWSL